MRRTGKTTLLKQLMMQCDIPQKHYFDLERIDVRALFSEPNYETIVQALSRQGTDFSKKVLLCIDEIQLVPNLPSVLKYLYDSYDVKFIVTGSSAYYMKNQFSESLAGRKKIFEIYLLEKSYLVKTIPVLANSPDREIVKAKKIYFLDNGIASLAGELSSESKFENAVLNQLMHRGEVAYYQLKTGREIDFILDQKQCFEVKETAAEADLKNTASLARNLDISESYVIGRHPVRVFDGFIWGGFLQ